MQGKDAQAPHLTQTRYSAGTVAPVELAFNSIDAATGARPHAAAGAPGAPSARPGPADFEKPEAELPRQVYR